MENITVKDLGNGYYGLKPEKGYVLLDKRTGMRHSDAVTKEPTRFVAVKV